MKIAQISLKCTLLNIISPQSLGLLNQTSNARGGMFSYDLLITKIPQNTQTIAALVILLCCLPEVDKALLLNTLTILDAGLREVSLDLSWKLPPYGLAFTVLEGAMQDTGSKKTSVFLSHSMIYEANFPSTIYSSGTIVQEVTHCSLVELESYFQ